METVQLQCGHCGQLMAVSVDHLGTQVHCPHCEQVVEVPEASSMDAATQELDEASLPKLRISTQDDESIMEDRGNNSDDLFGDRSRPRLELPPAGEATEDLRPAEKAALRKALAEPETPSVPEPDDDLPVALVRRPRQEASMLVPILLMFLIPYALATTGFIAWLIYSHSNQRLNPLEGLPDPKPGEGGPRQIQHDLDVSLKTPLQQALRVGDLEVTPLRVERSPNGDLTLSLKMVNVSKNVEFNPMHDDFCKYRESLAVGKPYTFLEPLGKPANDRLYGGYLEWHLGPPGREKPTDHFQRMGPGKEMLIQLTTRDKDKDRVRKLIDQPQHVLWRVQVRRGFMPTRNGPKSATAVIGVEFNTGSIEKGA